MGISKIITAILIGFCLPFMARAQERRDITPVPSQVTWAEGYFRRNGSTTLWMEAALVDRHLIGQSLQAAGWKLKADEKQRAKNQLRFRIVGEIAGISSPEGYTLTATPHGIDIEACTGAGLFYGLQTLLQLDADGTIPAVSIKDEPRLDYRGIMIDVSRHFFGKEFIKKQIDVLSHYKMNRLHLHLTDAAGWRIEIKKYPRLTQLAAWRPEATWKEWGKNGHRYCEASAPHAYGGFYTQEDIRELVEYATAHHVTIIPEIEMPSHSEEVLTAYPELSCTHEPYKQSDFCVGNEKTFEFLENVLLEVMELFPSPYIHIGGDEAGKASWKTCPLCHKRMTEENLANVDELQSYLIHRIERFLNAHGRQIIGWDEILDGGLAPNATVMSWRGTEGGLKAVRAGHKAIMSPGEFCYLDGYQDAPYSQPEAIGGYLPLAKVYGYNPVPDTLNASSARLIYGIQGNVWAEYIPTPEQMEYMLYPRAIALAETGWSKQHNRNYTDFHRRVLPILDQLNREGYHTFDLKKEIGNRPEAAHPVSHLAVGKAVHYNAPYWRNYPAAGDATLTDGLQGGWNYNDHRWQGFVTSKRVDVVIDLGKVMPIRSVAATFMQICGPDVYLPAHIIVSASADGTNFTTLSDQPNEVVKDNQVTFKTFGWNGTAQARYVRYQALPSEKYGGVLFTDEIIIH